MQSDIYQQGLTRTWAISHKKLPTEKKLCSLRVFDEKNESRQRVCDCHSLNELETDVHLHNELT